MFAVSPTGEKMDLHPGTDGVAWGEGWGCARRLLVFSGINFVRRILLWLAVPVTVRAHTYAWLGLWKL